MTHVWDLANFLVTKGVKVRVALKDIGYVNDSEAQVLLSNFTHISPFVYTTAEELGQYVHQDSDQIIHAHSDAVVRECVKISRQLPVPLIITLHSVYPWDLWYRDVLKSAAQIIAVGSAQAQTARSFNDKVIIIENGIDIQRFSPNPLGQDDDGPLNILWYGRVDGLLSRGIHTLDKLAPHLPEDICFRAVGETDINLINIPLVGWVDDPVPLLQAAHITFAHSRSLREAMACGSVGFLLGHGYGGLVTEKRLVEENLVMDAFWQYFLPRPRVDGILEDILQLANDRILLRTLRQESRRIAVAHFGVDTMLEKTMEVYGSVLRSK